MSVAVNVKSTAALLREEGAEAAADWPPEGAAYHSASLLCDSFPAPFLLSFLSPQIGSRIVF